MNILENIQNSEQAAAEIKRGALAKGREILRVSERDAQKAAALAVDAAESAAADKRRAAAATAEEKAAQFLSASAQTDDELIQIAQAKLEKAVSYIVRLAEDVK